MLTQTAGTSSPRSEDTVVCLGDCVNRGPDSKGVIDQLIQLNQRCNLICILGNHEEVMLECKTATHALDRWMYQGGMETLMSYGPRGNVSDIPDEHWQFLETFVEHFETQDYAFVHANYEWYLPFDEQPTSLLRWTSIDDSPPKEHVSSKKVVLGHQPGDIRDAGHFICIDTKFVFCDSLTAAELRLCVSSKSMAKTITAA